MHIFVDSFDSFLQDVMDTTSLDHLKTLFQLRKLTLYMASNYQRLKKNVVGISWDRRAIMHQSDRFKMMTFPRVS